VRYGDYSDPESLEQAFAGVEKLLFISTTAFSDAVTQHGNVIDAAKAAGVGHIHYTSVQRKQGSGVVISHVTEWEDFTVDALERSGLPVTLLRNSVYVDSLPFMLGDDVIAEGVRAPGPPAPAALVTRGDLAEANAIILASEGHVGKEYTLTGSETVDLPAIARSLSEVAGRSVSYTELTSEAFVDYRVAKGLPRLVAAFMGEWFQAIAAGEFAEVSSDLEQILERKPTTAAEYLKTAYARALEA
jgi:NAD(P)H dehydrogenase (quinone)